MWKTTAKTPDRIIQEIKRLKTTTDMTMSEIAKQVGVTCSTVSRYLSNGQPSYRKSQEMSFLDKLVKLNNKNKNVRQFISSIGIGEKIEIAIIQKRKQHIFAAEVEQINKNCIYAKSEEGKRFSIYDYQLLMGEMKIRKVG